MLRELEQMEAKVTVGHHWIDSTKLKYIINLLCVMTVFAIFLMTHINLMNNWQKGFLTSPLPPSIWFSMDEGTWILKLISLIISNLIFTCFINFSRTPVFFIFILWYTFIIFYTFVDEWKNTWFIGSCPSCCQAFWFCKKF